jgi:hypothetical protein
LPKVWSFSPYYDINYSQFEAIQSWSQKENKENSSTFLTKLVDLTHFHFYNQYVFQLLAYGCSLCVEYEHPRSHHKPHVWSQKCSNIKVLEYLPPFVLTICQGNPHWQIYKAHCKTIKLFIKRSNIAPPKIGLIFWNYKKFYI